MTEVSEPPTGVSNLLSMLTIVIPTVGRPGRAMTKAHYWAKQGCTVHVLDGSDKRDPHADSSIPQLVSYHHLPGSTIASRIARAGGELVNTRYVMLQPDDDVFLSGALASIITSLEHDRAAVGASGVALRLQPSSFGPYLVRVAYPQMLERARGAGKSGTNLRDFMRNYYMSVLWGVVRADVFKNVSRRLGAVKTGAFGIEELFFEMGVNGMGRVLALPEVYWVRNPTVPTQIDLWTSGPQAERIRPWFLDSHSLDHKIFVKEMAKVLDASGVVKDGSAFGASIQGVEAYGEFFLSKSSSVTRKSAKKKHNLLDVTRSPSLRRTRKSLIFPRFLRNWVLSVTLSSKRRLEEGFPQPLFTFFVEANKAGIKLDKEAFLRAAQSMR